MARCFFLLVFLLSAISCRQETAQERIQKMDMTETSAGKQGVGSAEKPVGKMISGVRFQQKGLEIEDAFVLRGETPLFTHNTVTPQDTVRIPMLIRGWDAPDGIARMKYACVVRRPDGSVATRLNNFKEIGRINLKAGEGVEDFFYFEDLDTTLAYYDYEFTITDVGNGRSLTGAYRAKLK